MFVYCVWLVPVHWAANLRPSGKNVSELCVCVCVCARSAHGQRVPSPVTTPQRRDLRSRAPARESACRTTPPWRGKGRLRLCPAGRASTGWTTQVCSTWLGGATWKSDSSACQTAAAAFNVCLTPSPRGYKSSCFRFILYYRVPLLYFQVSFTLVCMLIYT